jgi:transcription antitermination factor NusG
MLGVGLAWYAIQVKWRTEKAVNSTFTYKGYECFLPLYDSSRQWSDRVKAVSVPLFPGYLFSRFDLQHRLPILTTPYVVGIVGNGKMPVSVEETELEAVRRVLQNKLVVEPWESLQPGDPVEVVRGPLTGLEGTFVRHRGASRLLLSITLIGRAVAVEIDSACVKSFRRRPIAFRSSPLVNALAS